MKRIDFIIFRQTQAVDIRSVLRIEDTEWVGSLKVDTRHFYNDKAKYIGCHIQRIL